MPTTQPQQEATSVKETLTSIIIAFALAFVFRGFVIEAFVIPTGSMAPTLLGAHMSFKSPASGYEWTENCKDFNDRYEQDPKPIQSNVTVHDPMTGMEIQKNKVPRSWGDRIFVMKYLYSIYDPERFDVVVFKNPTDPSVNYIKRLIGLPNEMIALVDGDVFVRKTTPGEAINPATLAWGGEGWHVARKPERAQRTMWQLLFSSEYTPQTSTLSFSSPWAPDIAGDWKVNRPEYEYTGTAETRLWWDAKQQQRRELNDQMPYNEQSYRNSSPPHFPVSDLRLSLGFRPKVDGERVSAVVVARGHEFRADIQGQTATLRMRRVGQGVTPDEAWKDLAEGTLKHALAAGKVTNIDFWHVDQSLQLFIDDSLLVRAEYDWSPAERIRLATGLDLNTIRQDPESLFRVTSQYSKPGVRFEFSGGGFTLYRVSLSRDIHYTPAIYSPGDPAKATHPSTTAVLSPDQFFTCGDNSPRSSDARLWTTVNPWVAQIDPVRGVVNRDLLIGKAFLVYFPAPRKAFDAIPVPDFGSMRFIW